MCEARRRICSTGETNAEFLLLLAGPVFTWLLMGRNFPLVTTSVRTLVLAAFIALACTTRRSIHLMLALVILALHLWFTYSYSFMVAASPKTSLTRQPLEQIQIEMSLR